MHATRRVWIEIERPRIKATRVHCQSTSAITPDHGLTASLSAAAPVIERRILINARNLLDRERVEAPRDTARPVIDVECIGIVWRDRACATGVQGTACAAVYVGPRVEIWMQAVGATNVETVAIGHISIRVKVGGRRIKAAQNPPEANVGERRAVIVV